MKVRDRAIGWELPLRCLNQKCHRAFSNRKKWWYPTVHPGLYATDHKRYCSPPRYWSGESDEIWWDLRGQDYWINLETRVLLKGRPIQLEYNQKLKWRRIQESDGPRKPWRLPLAWQQRTAALADPSTGEQCGWPALCEHNWRSIKKKKWDLTI